MSDLHDLTALELGAEIRSGRLSATEVTRHYLQRIEEIDGAVGAYVTVTAELALRQAAHADDAARTGAPLSALHGVPVAVKDLTFVADVRCTFGSAAYTDHVAGHDDHVVTKLRGAGTVLLGKTNTPEFALPCYTENRLGPPTRNPWRLERTPGGSSGGSAAAVAAGLAPIAQGTDAGGSIRIPASACGLVGIKPSRGRVSNGPGPDLFGLSVHGPLARTVSDAAAMLDLMAGVMPGDTWSAPALPAGETFLQHAHREPGRLRIAALPTPMVPGVTPHQDCVDAYTHAVGLLDSLGHDVEELVLPAQGDVVAAFAGVLAVLSSLPQVRDAAVLMPFTRHLREQAENVTGTQVAQALAAFHATGLAITRQLFDAYDVLLSPTLAQPPGEVGALRDDDDPAAEFAAMAGFMPYTALHNITGLPSVNVPGQWNADGLPIGVMISGRHGHEATLISLAAQMEAARPWRDRKPALWS